MPNENDTEATRKDALNAYESLFGDAEPSAGDAVAEEQAGAGHGGADESDQDPRESDIPEKQGDEDHAGEKEADSSEDLKVVLSIKDGRATIGVQQPSSDPHIESFDDREVSELAQEVPAVLERARARWEDAPKHPAYERPTPSTGRRPRREQPPAQNPTAEGEAAEQQPETLRLF